MVYYTNTYSQTVSRSHLPAVLPVGTLVTRLIRPHEVDSCSDDDGSTNNWGGDDVCVSALAHGKIVFVAEIGWALSVPIRFGQIGVVGSDDVGLRHVATLLL